MKQKYLWIDHTSSELKALATQPTVAILPLGATEQHGPHLPVGVDTFLVEAFIQKAMEHMQNHDPVVVLPTLQVGVSIEHLNFPGTMSLSPELGLGWCKSVGQALTQCGVKRLLMMNAHGGNVGLMDLAGREIRYQNEVHVFHTSWYQLVEPGFLEGLWPSHELRFGIHGGAAETSLMMAMKPNLVSAKALNRHPSQAQDKAQRFPILGDGRSVKQSWLAEDYSATGVMGDASLATAEAGQALWCHVGKRLAQVIQELMTQPAEGGRLAGH
jgi:creatinine amidohydrolase